MLPLKVIIQLWYAMQALSMNIYIRDNFRPLNVFALNTET